MIRVNLDALKDIATVSRQNVWAKAQAAGRQPAIILYWSAGYYNTCFDDYHINITGDGEIKLSTRDLAQNCSHTYLRNSGSIGVSLCCAYGANTNNLGNYPPTKKQIEVMAQVIAVLADALWLTIDKKHVMTHGEAADNEDGLYPCEPYGPKNGCERWDLEFLGTSESPRYNPYADDGTRGGDILRGKANWYRNQSKE